MTKPSTQQLADIVDRLAQGDICYWHKEQGTLVCLPQHNAAEHAALLNAPAEATLSQYFLIIKPPCPTDGHWRIAFSDWGTADDSTKDHTPLSQ